MSNRLRAGQSLVEFVLLVPLLIFLIVNAANWGGFIFAWITVANAARSGAQYAVLDRAAAGAPAATSGTLIDSLIRGDSFSLINKASVTTNVCNNYNGTVTTVWGTCTGVPADPVPALYVSTSVDVTYTYQPFIPLFPVLGINFTLGNKTIHRRTEMRRLQ